MYEIIASTYEVIEKLGSGGGGVVYLANHLRLGKKVVLKADKRKLTTRPEILRREVDTLKDLSHTYIPQVYDFFAEGETVYTVMDFIDGESLDKPLKRGEKFTQPQIVKWACQLLEALSYLHNPVHGTPPRGIVHSDIKPANIMLRNQGDICLIDFNIALALGEENIVGRSAGYASPEHYGLDFSSDTPIMDNETEVIGNGDATVPMQQSEYSSSSKKIVIPDARSDIYSLGATLYHLLSGVKPAKSAVEVEKLSEEVFSPQIVKIISKAMNPNPDLRYQTVEEMLYDFEHLRENDPRTKRRRIVFAGAAAVFAIMLLGGAFTSFVGLRRMEATQRALTLAEYSQNALEAGDPKTAVDYALEALPVKKDIFTPKYTAEAQKALADASGVYNLSDGFKAQHTIELPSEVFKTVLSENGKTGAAVYAFEVAVFDTESGEIIAALPTVKSALADAVFIDDNTLVYAGANGVCAYDIRGKKELWTGKPATSIAVSADKGTIAAVYRDEEFAVIYDALGNEKTTVSFGGKKQYVIANDTFADPDDNLFELSSDGKFVAVSFADGGLTVYDTTEAENSVEIYDVSDFNHFEGGFSRQYFAFSSTGSESSVFAVIDMAAYEQTGGFELDSRIGVLTNESGIYISNKDTVVKIDPVTGEQQEVAYIDADVRMFSTDSENTIVAGEKNDYIFFDGQANETVRYNAGQTECSFVDIAGDYATVAGRDTPKVRILKKKNYKDAQVCTYDGEYRHDEARVNSEKSRIMLFDYQGFRIYDMNANLIKETAIPDKEKVYDQQYSKKSGNLAVLYNDAVRIYSGSDGEILYENAGLKSVFYAPYGISVLEQNGTLKLIDIDSADVLQSVAAESGYAAYCGMVVNEEFLAGGNLIGAARTGNGYLFAVSKGDVCSIYNQNGSKYFEIPVLDQTEAFFIDGAVILSPLHGTPTVYSLKNGRKLAELEKDSYMTYVTETGDYIITEYISANGEKYAIMLDRASFKTLARLPYLTDTDGDELIFDYNKGKLRKTRIYSIDELINLVKEGDF